MPQIGVYAICRNEAANVRPFLETVRDADYILIADTGSTDDTRGEIIAQQGYGIHADLYSIHIAPWRFDTARNTALAMMPAWVDVCLCLDLDETISPHWTDVIRDNWSEHVNNLVPWYQNSEGYEGWDGRRIHSRAGWTWRHPCHEQLYPYLIEPRYGYMPDITIKHPRTYWHNTYLPLCELAYKEDPTDSHAQYFLGREYFNVGQYDEAVTMLSRYLEGDTEKEERRQAHVFIKKAMAERLQSVGA